MRNADVLIRLSVTVKNTSESATLWFSKQATLERVKEEGMRKLHNVDWSRVWYHETLFLLDDNPSLQEMKISSSATLLVQLEDIKS